MNKELINKFLNELSSLSNVEIDNDVRNIYEKFNFKTRNNWTYNIENVFVDYNLVILTVYVPGRVMTGVASGKNINEAVDNSLSKAYYALYCESNSEEATGEAEEDKKNLNSNVAIDNSDIIHNDEDAVTIDQLDELEQLEQAKVESEVKENEDDNENPIPGSNITNRQIRFMNDFKEYNSIDTDDKFDYYVKTWAISEAVDNITTKGELVSAGYDLLENFINWIKKMQPALDEGIISPM